MFHAACIIAWQENAKEDKDKCPTCKTKIGEARDFGAAEEDKKDDGDAKKDDGDDDKKDAEGGDEEQSLIKSEKRSKASKRR